MNSFLFDNILAEKSLHTISSMDNSSNTSYTTPISHCLSADRRLSLTKAYSCSDTRSVNYCENCLFINPRQFIDYISKHELKTTPIIDCRSQIDFSAEHICSALNINCRAKLMARKLLSKRLDEIEPNLVNLFQHSDILMLYDQSTDVHTEDKLRSLPINLVVQAAKKSNKKVHIIQGGFDAIKNQYPHLIECAIELPKDKFDQDHVPQSPDAVDKENFTMTEILPRIFVGNTHDAQNLDRLTKHGITHIINSTPDLPFSWEKKCQYLRIDILDLPSQNIRKHFDTAYQFIDEALHTKANNILVHCSAGISRSPTLVLAYMIKKYHMKLDEAFQKMRQLRTIVDPNISFILQLREWEKKCSEITDDINSKTTPTTTGTYCGSTSKTKTENQTHSDSAIIVN